MGESIKNPKSFWDQRYQSSNTGWDLGEVSPPLKKVIDELENKNTKILIPGAGNAYEAEYLLKQGFTDVTIVDIAPTLIKNLHQRFSAIDQLSIIEGNFFEHSGQYNLILEQTFFCALDPVLRTNYVKKMHELLLPSGQLTGVLFDRPFPSGPPFGGSKKEYLSLFHSKFSAVSIVPCLNSHTARQGSEVFLKAIK